MSIVVDAILDVSRISQYDLKIIEQTFRFAMDYVRQAEQEDALTDADISRLNGPECGWCGCTKDGRYYESSCRVVIMPCMCLSQSAARVRQSVWNRTK